MKLNLLTSTVAVALLASSAAYAEQGCEDVVYSQEVLEKFPEITDACQAVVERDGELYTEVHARLGNRDRIDRVRLQLRMADNSLGPVHMIKGKQKLNIHTRDGSKLSFEELAPYQDITVYVPHNRWAFVSITETPAEEVEVVEIAMAEPEPEPQMLPKTATQLHSVGFGGAIALMLASLVTWRRKRK